MKKLLFIFGLLLLLLSAYVAFKLYLYRLPALRKSSGFNEWKKGLLEMNRKNLKYNVHIRSITSPPMRIDRIFRSMEGPMISEEYFLLDHTPDLIKSVFTPELIWITGYKVELLDGDGNPLSDDFMCHNNLNIGQRNNLPWKVKTLGSDTRLFTLTEGQTEIHLPRGYAIPVLSGQRFRIDFQVLNHNVPDAQMMVKHKVSIFYVKDSECPIAMRALYQQSVFMTRLVQGPAGYFNEPPGTRRMVNDLLLQKNEALCCSNPGQYAATAYPFRDKYNRVFTGHWVLPDSSETLYFDVTPMLALEKNSCVHFISVHVHPFCNELALEDAHEDKTLFTALPENFSDRIGLKHIPLYSSEKGFVLNKDHHFLLRSRYAKKGKERHTAMATMFLYLEES